MNPLISIIVPIYNVEKYLERCVDSIVKQTYENLEIILVNDGSLDNSFNIATTLSLSDNRIKVYSKENGGLSDARNYGLKHANCKYVAFIDSDDFIDTMMIETLFNAIEKRQADIAVCDMKYLYDDGNESFTSGGIFSFGNIIDEPSLITINNSACNKLYLTSMFDDVKFPIGKFYEDLATIPILLYKANKIVKVDRAFYVYYQRSGSIAHTASKKLFDIYEAISGCIEYVKSHGNEASIIKELYHLYIIHGLDITTLKIKDFDDKSIRKEYLRENMEYLNKYYPNWKNDSKLIEYNKKKKLIFKLLSLKMEGLVLRIYDK